jgi:hypothetical protein
MHDHEKRSAWSDKRFFQWFPNLADQIVRYLGLRKRKQLPPKPPGFEHVYLLARSFDELMTSLTIARYEAPAYTGPPDNDPDRISKGLLRRDDAILNELIAGGRLNEGNAYGWTPMQTVASCGNVEAIRWLLEAGASLRGALGSASKGGHADAVRFLLSKGCGVEERDRGMTPLMFAVHAAFDINRHLQVVRILVEHGADVNATCSESCGFGEEGQSVLAIAGGERYASGKPKGPPALIALLEAAGAKLNPPK